jgi:23S rRNA pseudouridine2605 synthase
VHNKPPPKSKSKTIRPAAKLERRKSPIKDDKDDGKKVPLKTLDRVLSKAGLGSRTDARFWIKVGRVKVNGKIIKDPGHWVKLDTDRVDFDGKPVQIDEIARVYIVLNKPRGYLTSYKDPEGRPTVYQLIAGIIEFLVPVGRLDLDTSGLLLMTNDTQFAEFVTNPQSKAPKTYLVKASTLLSDEQLDRLRAGLDLDDGPTRPAEVRRLRDSGKYTHFEMTITEGRNRQVRRMVEALGSKVLKLVRVAIGSLEIGGLEIGKWRALTPEEVISLRRSGSKSAQPTSAPDAPIDAPLADS